MKAYLIEYEDKYDHAERFMEKKIFGAQGLAMKYLTSMDFKRCNESRDDLYIGSLPEYGGDVDWYARIKEYEFVDS